MRDDLAAEACGALPPEEAETLARHLAVCAPCREAVARLRRALAALDAYSVVQPPAELIERTQRHVARQMLVRLPRPTAWSRRRVARVAVAAVILIAAGVWYLRPAIIRPSAGGGYSEAQLQGIVRALGVYAGDYDGHLPPARGWYEALTPYLRRTEVGAYRPSQHWSEDFIFMEGLGLWTGIGPREAIIVERRAGRDQRHRVVTRDGCIELWSDTDVRRIFKERPTGGALKPRLGGGEE